MLKIYIAFFIVVFSTFFSYGQEKLDMPAILGIEDEIVNLEKEIRKNLDKHKQLCKMEGLKQYHVFFLGVTDSIEEEDFLDNAFLYKLESAYFNRKKKSLFSKEQKYLKPWKTIICDSVGYPVAEASFTHIYVYNKILNEDIELARIFHEGKWDFIFYLAEHWANTYVGIKNDAVYVLKSTKEGLEVYTQAEFIECCYDDWVRPCKNFQEMLTEEEKTKRMLGIR